MFTRLFHKMTRTCLSTVYYSSMTNNFLFGIITDLIMTIPTVACYSLLQDIVVLWDNKLAIVEICSKIVNKYSTERMQYHTYI